METPTIEECMKACPDVKKALEIAKKAHKGQIRRSGKMYIIHPVRVFEKVFRWSIARYEIMPDDAIEFYNKDFYKIYESFYIVALLHDVLEDTSVRKHHLEKIFPSYVIRSLNAITKKKDEPYTLYLKRVKADYPACVVKISDIADNLPTAKEKNIKKYLDALCFLNQ